MTNVFVLVLKHQEHSAQTALLTLRLCAALIGVSLKQQEHSAQTALLSLCLCAA